MQRSTAKRRVATVPPQAAIASKAPGTGEGRSRSGLALVVFMRVVAAAWIVQGALQWTAILSAGPGGTSAFSALTPAAVAAAMFFAVVDFVAAIGLWLAAPWGGVIWLVAVLAQISVAAKMSGFFDHPLVVGAADAALVVAYFALLWLAARAADAEG